ncbi:hypothetical protein PAEPH01_0556 [Pancytospora epiphaga]|nr:hypothetical protein PAEPH01_0556 [Pancytospora epiphaga]
MLIFMSLLRAFLISDLATKNFITIGTNTVIMGPANTATDFEPIQGKNPAASLIIKDPVSGLVMDQSGGGDELISWGMHGGSNQCFKLVLAPNNHFYLMNKSKCLKYNAKNKLFIRGDCSDDPSPLNVYFKLSFKDKKEGRGLFEPTRRRSRHHGNVHFNPYLRTQSGFHLRQRRHHPIMKGDRSYYA